MDVWAWAVAAYDRPGVAEACLVLQDAHGQNIPFLLWAVWAGVTASAELAPAAQAARAWDLAATGPLRAVRRSLKAPSPPVDDAAREAVRQDVKACELRAERVLLEALAGLAARGGASPRDALEAAARAWGNPPPPAALAALAAALEPVRR